MGLTGKELVNFFARHPQIKQFFLGVFFIDQVPKIPVHHFCIINTSLSTEAQKVSHWIGLCRYSKKLYECFDSLGTTAKFLNDHFDFSGEVEFNSKRLQPLNSILCGAYVITYLVFRCLNPELTFEEVVNSHFYANPEKNEKNVSQVYTNF